MAQIWLLRFGTASSNLRNAFTKLATWMASELTPWAAIRSLMIYRLIALGKMPGIRSVGIGDIWRRLLAKCLLQVTGEEAEITCGAHQLCGGMCACIKAASMPCRYNGARMAR